MSLSASSVPTTVPVHLIPVVSRSWFARTVFPMMSHAVLESDPPSLFFLFPSTLIPCTPVLSSPDAGNLPVPLFHVKES
jgi:hypothetical protein